MTGADYVLIALMIAIMTTLAVAQLMAVGLIIGGFILDARKGFRRDSGRSWGVALLLVAGLSAINALHDGLRGAGEGVGKTWAILLAPATATIAKRMDEASFRRLEKVICWSGAAIAALFLMRWGMTEPFFNVKPRQAFHSNPGVSGMILIPASLFILFRSRLTGRSLSAWLLIVIAIWFLNVRATIASWFIITLLCLLLQRGIRLRSIAFIGFIFILTILTTLVVPNYAPIERWNLFDLSTQSAIVHRLVIWSQVIAQFIDHPILGNGFNHYAIDLTVIAPKYHHYLVIGIHPHNGYLMTLHAVGVIGLFTLLAVVGYFLREVALPNGIRTTDRWRIVASLSLFAMMISGLADKMPYVTLVSIQVWALVGLALARPVMAEETAND